MTVERCFSVTIKTWRTKYFNSKIAAIVSAVIFVVIFTYCTYFSATIRYTDEYGRPLNLTCFVTASFLTLMEVIIKLDFYLNFNYFYL